MFGNPETTPGGLALKFYASIRIDIRKIEALKREIQLQVVATEQELSKTKLPRHLGLPSLIL